MDQTQYILDSRDDCCAMDPATVFDFSNFILTSFSSVCLTSVPQMLDCSCGLWGHDNVHEFLKNYYGPQLVSLCKEKSVIVGGKEETISATEDLTVATNALVGADWSCIGNSRRQLAFGALGCYWRTQQKNRK